MPRHHRYLSVLGPPARFAGIALAAAALACAVFSSRWAVAETIVEHVGDPAVLEGARSWEPANPDIPHALGVAVLTAAPTETGPALGLLGEAIELGPGRLGVWVEYGRTLELAGRQDEAAAAFIRAAELAPAHSQPPWLLGNLYVRQGRLAQAIPLLRRAATAQPGLAPAVIRTIWLASGRDLELVLRGTEGNSALETALVGFLAREGRADQAAAAWLRIAGPSEDGPLPDPVVVTGRGLAASLLRSGHIESAIAVYGRLEPDRAPATETVTDGGFERPLPEKPSTPFEWVVNSAPDARASLDAGRSNTGLKIEYAVKGNGPGASFTQILVVRPGASYELRLWVRADDIVSGGMPAIRVTDAAARGGQLGASPVLPIGSYDWREIRVPFIAPASGTVAVSLHRASCGEVCPIFGSLWFDDVSLVRVQ